MKTTLTLIAALMLAACAGAAPSAPPAGQPFTGEVWGWDEKNSIVTLRQGGQTVRVKVTPDQLVGLRLHERVTVRGELSPAEIEQFVIPAGRLVARGPAAMGETTGSVTRISSTGTVGIDSPQGPVTVWIATPGAQPFRAGDQVRVRLHLQPLEVLPAESRDVTRAAMSEPAAPTGSEPGEYAVVRGRVTAVAGGQVTVESSRGPVTVWLPAGTTLRVGDWVDVQTSVHAMR
jgi:hypothetical protein